MPIRAVLFDLGNTLIRFGPPDHERIGRVAASRLTKVLVELGHTNVGSLEDAWSLYRAVWEASDLEDLDGLGQTTAEQLLDATLTKLGFRLSQSDLLLACQAWWLGFPAYGHSLFADAAATLAELRKAGFRLGMINNGPNGMEYLRPDLDLFGIASYFDVLVNSADFGRRKPHPSIFLHALADLGVAPDEALMVGDIPSVDVLGAKNAGLVAVWKRNHQPLPSPIEADYVVDDIGELLTLPPLVQIMTAPTV